MADPAPAHQGEHRDGRFGERFDDELQTKGIVQVLVGILVVCALGFLVTWLLLRQNLKAVEAAKPPPSPVVEANERRLPRGPLLQADPEAELQEMRRELGERLNGYGWVDEGRGIVHIPIETAIELMVERQAAGASPAAEPAEMAEEESPE